MRAGLPFGLGISDGLEKQGCDVAIYFIDEQIDSDTITSSNGRTIILADAVINSGKSIEHIYKNLPETREQIKEWAWKNYSWDSIGAETRKLYKSL